MRPFPSLHSTLSGWSFLTSPPWLFLCSGVYLWLGLWWPGLMRGLDAAELAVWWLTLGASLMLLLRPVGLRAMQVGWWTLAVVFGLDAAVQAVVRDFFGVKPQPAVVAEALANTSPAESWGFVQGHAGVMAQAALFWLGLLCLAWLGQRALRARAQLAMAAAASGAAAGQPAARRRWPLALLVAFTLLLHANPAMLRDQPFLRWGVLYLRHAEARAEIQDIEAVRANVAARAADWLPAHDQQARTVVLVIGESDNRLNWGAYGYARNTTQALTDTLAQLPGQWQLLPEPRSVEAFTLPSLRRTLVDAPTPSADAWLQRPDLVMLAQAAGYRVSWLSNQPKGEGWFAAMAASADDRVFVNNGNWRDSSAQDLQLIAPLQQRLAQTYPREFIVLHLLGQHFHYEQRCPGGVGPYSGVWDDAVMQGLRQQGRSQSTLQARNAYDNAVHCGAQVLAQVLEVLQQARGQRPVSLLYFSDHAQEVGHHRDFAGHSQADASGYTVPVLLWQGAQVGSPVQVPRQTPFSLDQLPALVRQLLGLQADAAPKQLPVTATTP